MAKKGTEKFNLIINGIIFLFFLFSINTLLGFAVLVILIFIMMKSPGIKNKTISYFSSGNVAGLDLKKLVAQATVPQASRNSLEEIDRATSANIITAFNAPRRTKKLEKNKKYLQVALNGTLAEAREVLGTISQSEKIIIEAGTPLIKTFGTDAIREISYLRPASYIVADIKTADLAEREVAMVANAGASAATCLGVAPIETINDFISACSTYGIDSMIDMMNVENPLLVLKRIKAMPDVVILHRGVDETEFSKGKMIPYYQIKQLKGAYNIKVSVAGGDTLREVQSAIFNDADIVVVWKNFTRSDKKTGNIISGFLKIIR